MARPVRRHARGRPGHRCPRDPRLSISASCERGQGRGTAAIQAVTLPSPRRPDKAPRIGTAVSATPTLNSSKGCTRARGSRLPRADIRRIWLNPVAATRAPARPARTRRDRWAPGYLRARHPEIAGGSVHHVQAVSSRVIPSRCRAARSLLLLRALLQRPIRKRPSPHWERALSCGN